MLDEGSDEIRPFGHVFWRRHVAVIPENGFAAAGQRVRHETQFHKRLHADAVEKVIKLVNVLPVVLRHASFLAIDAHVVVEQTVHADVSETALVVCVGQLPLPVGAQTLVRAACADAEIEHGVERAVRLAKIGRDDSGCFVCGGVGQSRGGEESRQAEGEIIYFSFHKFFGPHQN